MKRILGLLLVFLLSAFPLPVYAEEAFPYLVALGDSITTGYEMEGGRYGNRSYVNLTAADFGMTRENYVNYAVNGYTAPDMIAQLPSLRPDIAAADILVFDIGYNDILNYPFYYMCRALGNSVGSLEDVRQYAAGLTEEEKAECEEYLQNISAGPLLPTVLADFDANVQTILDLLREYNPDARIYMQSIYNPLAALDVFNDFTEKVVGDLNDILRNKAEENGCAFFDVHAVFAGHEAEYTYMMQNDIHPNEAGHEAIHAAFVEALRADGYLGGQETTAAESAPETEQGENDNTEKKKSVSTWWIVGLVLAGGVMGYYLNEKKKA